MTLEAEPVSPGEALSGKLSHDLLSCFEKLQSSVYAIMQIVAVHDQLLLKRPHLPDAFSTGRPW